MFLGVPLVRLIFLSIPLVPIPVVTVVVRVILLVPVPLIPIVSSILSRDWHGADQCGTKNNSCQCFKQFSSFSGFAAYSVGLI